MNDSTKDNEHNLQNGIHEKVNKRDDLTKVLKPSKSKGWTFLYETFIKQMPNTSVKYGDNLIMDSNDCEFFSPFSITLSTNNIPRDEELKVAHYIEKMCNLRSEFIKEFKEIETPIIDDSHTKEIEREKKLFPEKSISSEPIYKPHNIIFPQKCNAFINMKDGIIFVHWNPIDDTGPTCKEECNESNKLEEHKKIKTTLQFLNSLQIIMNGVQDPACKSFCYKRLKYLEQKFDFHVMFNGGLETRETEKIKHRDFYNIRKVDTHIHHSACMQQKVLLGFIREKYKSEPDAIVYVDDNGEKMALKDIFDKDLEKSAYEATVDSLAVHALGHCFHRFDLFNEKYNPFGQKLLRNVFLKTDNYIEGRYLAEITKNEIDNLEKSKYQHVEWRISIYGKKYNEWYNLAKWVLNNHLFSVRVRWVIQVPRLYHIYKKMNLIQNFAQFLSNVFQPCFEALKNPQQNKEIFTFLHYIVAWDSVDDESIVSKYTMEGGEIPPPELYDFPYNPPYSYYAYYMYANIRSLNEFLILRNMRTISFRPHCGEVGNITHLAAMFLLAEGINHGINLKKSPVLLYLYYLKQIGLAISPLSNNALFLEIEKNPFKTFFKIGLNVSLSTDDPLMFHFTMEPLLEEYSICAHTWKLSTVDLCEIAKNSVLQSGFEPPYKKHWLGLDYNKPLMFQNVPEKTNISNIRINYRSTTYNEEKLNINRLLNYNKKI